MAKMPTATITLNVDCPRCAEVRKALGDAIEREASLRSRLDAAEKEVERLQTNEVVIADERFDMEGRLNARITTLEKVVEAAEKFRDTWDKGFTNRALGMELDDLRASLRAYDAG